MRALEIIQHQFQRDLQQVHLARLRAVFAAAMTAVRCGRVTLTALGRAIAERTTHKHGIKRIDRLLGNDKLHVERLLFYRSMARRILEPGSRPIIIRDWTAVTPKLWALAAAVSFEGRALTVYAEVHPISRYMKPYVNAAFLRRLKTVLPPKCVPIILADAGFRAPFMALTRKMGWDYVIRLRGPLKIRTKYGRGWTRLSYIFALAESVPKDLGTVELAKHGRYVTRIVGVEQHVSHRKYHCRVRRAITAQKERRAAREPWILATSLDLEPCRVVALYARRMQIEETFRDAKSTRYGMSLTYARTHSKHRANVLLLLANLAHLFSVLLGLAAEAAQLHRGYQANTVRTKRILALATLGRLVAASANTELLQAALKTGAWDALRERLGDWLVF